MFPVLSLSLDDVLGFLDAESETNVGLVLEARSVILRLLPNVTEDVHWRTLSYYDHRVGGHVKGAICQLSVCDGQVRIAFIHGAALPDPCALLHGSRKAKRFLTVTSSQALHAKAFRDLVLAASHLVEALHGPQAPDPALSCSTPSLPSQTRRHRRPSPRSR
jgi:hypothetical protein